MFMTLPSLASPRYLHTATQLPDGRVLVAGGRYSDFGVENRVLTSVEIFDPRTLTWTAGTPMHRQRMRQVAVSLPGGGVLVAGGNYTDAGILRDPTAEIFDPSTDTWSSVIDMPLEPTSAVGLLAGKVLFIGYLDGTNRSFSTMFDPKTQTFAPTVRVTGMSLGSSATLLRNGSVLTAGSWRGYGDGPPELRGEAAIFDPATGRWAATTPMQEARQPAPLVTIDDGRALIVSNFSGELYDVTKETWTKTGDTASSRDETQLLALGDGRVIAIGSSYGDSASKPVIEALDPVSGRWATIADFRVLEGLTATMVGDASVLIAGGLLECRFGQACDHERVVGDAFLLALPEAP